MIGSSATTLGQTPYRCAVPDGFFDEVAEALESDTAEDIADAVLAVCTQRGILHPELEEIPDDELRAEEIRDVFSLLGSVTDAVSDGTIVPRRLRVDDELDSSMAQAWQAFTDEAADPEAEAATAAMLKDGKPAGNLS
ncbi:hypothetical protein [Mycolicibacterium sp.]|uniref:hypothetical protein n=1 Tax=Mycolicibacterium sp. TaxID=2320850 RepID=UPI00356022C7